MDNNQESINADLFLNPKTITPITLADIDEALDSTVENALRPTIYDAFYAELVALCDKHQVTIAAEDNLMYISTRGDRGDGYDDTAIWMGIPPKDRTDTQPSDSR